MLHFLPLLHILQIYLYVYLYIKINKSHSNIHFTIFNKVTAAEKFSILQYFSYSNFLEAENDYMHT